MTPLLPQLKRELHAAHERRGRGRRRPWGPRMTRGAGMIALPAVALTVTALLVILLGHGHAASPPPPAHRATGARHSRASKVIGPALPSNPTHQQTEEERYLYRAFATVTRRDHACLMVSAAFSGTPTISHGAPDRTILSLLAVLRRPARPSDRLPARITYHPYQRDPTGSLPNLKGIYIRDIRRARTRYGAGYYLIPAADTTGFRSIPARCYSQQRTAVNHELPGIPQRLKRGTLALAPRFLDQLRSDTAPAAGVCLAALNHTGNGDGCASGFTVADIEQGHTLQSGGPTGVGVVYGLVPDGVHTVTLRYPHQSLTVAAINNVFILHDPGQRLPNDGFPTTVIWRDAQHAIVKTISYH